MARLYRYPMVFLQLFLQYIQHSHAVAKSYHHVESGWVYCYGEGFFFELLDDWGDQGMGLGAVVPDADGAVRGAGSDDGFLEADIHAENRMGMEATNEIIIA